MRKDSIERYANFKFKFDYKDDNSDAIFFCESDLYFDMKFYEDDKSKSYIEFETRVIPRTRISDEGVYVLNKIFPVNRIIYYENGEDLRTKCKDILNHVGRGTIFFNLSERLIQEFDVAFDIMMKSYEKIVRG